LASRADRDRRRCVVERLGGARHHRTVAREQFAPTDRVPNAYDDARRPIGSGQTISLPYVVAMTVQVLQLRGHGRAPTGGVARCIADGVVR